jgi:hypothetical protein
MVWAEAFGIALTAQFHEQVKAQARGWRCGIDKGKPI